MTQIFKFIIISVLLWVSQAQAGPLHDAAREGNSAEIIRLLDAGADIHERDIHNNTLLHLAAGAGYNEVITSLLAAGAFIEGRNNHG